MILQPYFRFVQILKIVNLECPPGNRSDILCTQVEFVSEKIHVSEFVLSAHSVDVELQVVYCNFTGMSYKSVFLV